MKLRVGLVGIGDNWEGQYRPALRTLQDRFEVQAVYAEVPAKASQVAEEFTAETVRGFRSLVSRSDIDAVLILSSAWIGPLPILAACEFGKAIYCAPAFAVGHDRAEEIKARIETAGIAFTAEFPRRHSPATLRLKELIATRLGQPQMLFCHERQHDNHDGNSATERKQNGDSFSTQLMELVDWCNYVVGQSPQSVLGMAHHSSDRSRDYQMMSLDFPTEGESTSATMAQISCGTYVPQSWPEAISFRPPAQLQVCCEHGIAFVDLPTTLIWFDQAGRHLESLDQDRPVGEQLLTQFHRSVTSLVRNSEDLNDAFRALQIVTVAEQSAKDGTRIMLS